MGYPPWKLVRALQRPNSYRVQEVAMSSNPRRVYLVIPLGFGFALVLALAGGWLP